MNKGFNNLKIGMLGGGQLGRMLLQKAVDYSLYFRVLDPDPAAPCRYLAEEFVTGSFNDFDTVYSFGRGCDLITIEIEHVNVKALEQLEKEGVKVFPQPAIIQLVQDKGEQKKFFRDNNIPTAAFRLIGDREDLLRLKPVTPAIQKLRKGGYDGKGVKRLNNTADAENAFDAPSVIEEVVPFQKEISVIVARNRKGECRCFPSVEMDFNAEANLVEFLQAPADISPETEEMARELALRVANGLSIVGVLAVEMFLTNDGNLLVNEIAPRPHNSGHHTIEANKTSQYDQHLRAILDLPLGNTATLLPAVLVNLLGEKNHEGIACYKALHEVLGMEGVHIHLYGKKYTRPFRKMGHVTVTGKDIREVRARARLVKDLLRVISE
jgi:5-(carboxyamino)imidazole ribonucleotide synthase